MVGGCWCSEGTVVGGCWCSEGTMVRGCWCRDGGVLSTAQGLGMEEAGRNTAAAFIQARYV